MNLPDTLLPCQRPRERLLRLGAPPLNDAELLALALRTGRRGCNALELAQRLLVRYGGLRGVFSATAQELCAEPGLGAAKACSLLVAPELSRRAIEESLRGRQTMNHPDEVKRYCRTALSHQPIEHCIALFLDQQLQLLACGELAQARWRAPRSSRARWSRKPCAAMPRPSSWPTTILRAAPGPAVPIACSRASWGRPWPWWTSSSSTTSSWPATRSIPWPNTASSRLAAQASLD